MTPPSNTGSSEIPLRPEEYRLLRDLFSSKIGVFFGPDARFSLERRLRERLIVLRLASFAEYHQYLSFHPLAAAEWDEVVELLTTNETYFYREDYQLRSFRDEVLPMLAEQARARKRLSIWSAGCSTGEEVYTIAMLVRESRRFENFDVRIYGCDLSRRCIATARRAVYGTGSFRTIPIDLKARYFSPISRADARLHTPLPFEAVRAGGNPNLVSASNGAPQSPISGAARLRSGHDGLPHGLELFQVVEPLRAMCHFGQMNLLDEDRIRLLGHVDAIFCRNVAIYFDAHARRRVITTFHDRLHPGGVLLLGHSESLLNVSTAFELLHLKEDLVYRKPQGQFPRQRG